MALRNNQSQGFHDRVIEIAAGKLISENKYTVYTNPNGYHNARVGNYYPDIILTQVGINSVVFIIEVETEDSVTEQEAVTQWKPYSLLGGTFYLLVPHSYRGTAESICRKNGIQVKLATFWVDQNQQLLINYE